MGKISGKAGLTMDMGLTLTTLGPSESLVENITYLICNNMIMPEGQKECEVRVKG